MQARQRTFRRIGDRVESDRAEPVFTDQAGGRLDGSFPDGRAAARVDSRLANRVVEGGP
jgi:hypothetical protein